MKRRLLSNLKDKQGFVLAFAMMMILLLMVMMTAMVTTVGYTNKATAKKSNDQQLQLSAQSAIETLATELALPENIAQLTNLASANASQKYDLSSAGITDEILAQLSTDPSRPGFALLKVTASRGGKSYTLTKYIPMKSNMGPKNDLIENMVVAYWPENLGGGFTSGKDMSNVVMDGSVIIDNEYYKDGYGNSGNQGTEYGNAEAYKSNPSTESTAVKIKGGTFKELVTTGNLYIEGDVDGVSKNDDDSATTTIASAMGQMVINRATIGKHVMEIGAGGYYTNKADSDLDKRNKKTGSMTLSEVKFEGGATNVLSRDSVKVTAEKISGSLNNFFIGGDFKLALNRQESLSVANDLRGYKTVNIELPFGSNLDIGVDVASSKSATVDTKDGGKISTGGSIVSAMENISLKGSGTVDTDSLLAGHSISAPANTQLKLSGSDAAPGYGLFAGGNYATGDIKYYEKVAPNRGKVDLKRDSLPDGMKAVVNNASTLKQNVLDFAANSNDGATVDAFRIMNTLWLKKAQKVTKGGFWGSGNNTINFAIALITDSDLLNNYKSAREASPYTCISDASQRYNPKNPGTGDQRQTEFEKNFRWYNHKTETYNGGMPVPVTHELKYTTDDEQFMLRRQLRDALGGSSNSLDLIADGDYQGRFVETARTAIPYDGAIKDIEIAYPKVNGGYGASLDETGYAPVEVVDDKVYIGNSGQNYGKIAIRDGQFLFDGSQDIDISGKTLYFRVTNPEIPNGAGDYILMNKDAGREDIVLKNKIVVEYQLNGTTEADIDKLSCVRFFVEPNKKLMVQDGFSIEGKNVGSVNADSFNDVINGVYYEKIQPEVYFFFMKPTRNNVTSFEARNNVNINAFIIAPWSYVDTRVANNGKENKVFSGVILCKDLAVADSGTYKHYKPLAFGYAMSDDVFKLPSIEDAE